MYRNKTLENESVRSHMIITIIATLLWKIHVKKCIPKESVYFVKQSEAPSIYPGTELRKLKIGGLLHDIEAK